MLKKTKLSALFIIVFMFFSSVNSFAEINVTRISGFDRYETALNVNKKYFYNVGNQSAVLAGGGDFRTALYGSYLASSLKIPYFINPKSGLRSDVFNQIKKLNIKSIFIVGTYDEIDSTVSNYLETKGIRIHRLFDRQMFDYGEAYIRILPYEVDNIVFSFLFPNQEIRNTIASAIYVNDKKFPDLLSSAPFAAELARNRGTFLVNPYDLMIDPSDFAEDEPSLHYMTIGGYDSIDKRIKTAEYTIDNIIPNDSRRIAGSDRYETAIEVAKSYKKYLNKDISTVILVNGQNYPDALSSGSSATAESGAVLLTNPNILTKSTKDYILNNNIKKVIIIGGEKSVSKTIENELKNINN